MDILTLPLNQYALDVYLQSGHFAEHIGQVRRAYQERRDAMLLAARQYLPAGATWRRPEGGNYVWVEMPPSGPTATDLYLAAINYNVAFAIGSVFSASGSFNHAMRLNFVGHAPHEIEEGMRRLGKAWKEVLTRALARERMVKAWQEAGFALDFVETHAQLARGNEWDRQGRVEL